ncbi:pentapeptide repeat-containing protein [Acerihabitans sp.]|uniref:pentapeptide repeat-containing protein n=1 Tax=Acerihabitans sp. TaxID=2811394 RepID=UPI002EDB8BF2
MPYYGMGFSVLSNLGACWGCHDVQVVEARKKAARVLKDVEFFYKNGYLNNEHVAQADLYEKFAQAWADAFLLNRGRYGFDIPEKLEFNFSEHTITIITEQAYGQDVDLATIKVSSSECTAELLSVELSIDKKIYDSVSTAVVLLHQYPQARSDISLTGQRRIIIKGDCLRNADLRGIELGEADLSGADLFAAGLNSAN